MSVRYSVAALIAVAMLTAAPGMTPQEPDLNIPVSHPLRVFADVPDADEPGHTGMITPGPPLPPELLQTLEISQSQTSVNASEIGEPNLETVASPNAYPASAVVFVRTSLEDCTGWLYGPDIIALAAHCVYHAATDQWAAKAVVSIGLHGSAGPTQICDGIGFFATEGWTKHHREEYDYGAIRLDCSAGATAGFFGLRASALPPVPATILGYRNGRKQSFRDVVPQRAGQQIFYPHDTYPGMSGSPLYVSSASCSACAIAIHATGLHGAAAPHDALNHGVWLTRKVIKVLRMWKAAP